ncbi:MAG: hypothetical protein GQ534_10865 [Candidatus Delongbacteria bacterium]|nr:hypothetical protein [Candidatus Delongbacteria bacterium]
MKWFLTMVVFCLMTTMFAENPSSENFTLQQWGIASGNNATNQPTSANFVLSGSVIGIISNQDASSTSYTMQPGYYLGLISGDILPPEIVSIITDGTSVTVDWMPVTGATSYKVFSSSEAINGFTEDTSGTFDGTSWTAPTSVQKKFIYIKAIN